MELQTAFYEKRLEYVYLSHFLKDLLFKNEKHWYVIGGPDRSCRNWNSFGNRKERSPKTIR